MNTFRLHTPWPVHAYAARRLRDWLVLWNWIVCVGLVGPTNSHADIPPADAVLQRQWQDLAAQLVPLRQTVTPPAQISMAQNQALQKQIGALEHQQQQLGEQLAQMQMQRTQQIQHLESRARGLNAALWALAGLTLALGAVAWHFRRLSLTTKPLPLVPDTTEPEMTEVPEIAPLATEPVDQPSIETPSQPQDIASAVPLVAFASVQAPQAANLSIGQPASPQPSVVPAWAALVAADLNHTQQTLAQAREGFMQPARIDH